MSASEEFKSYPIVPYLNFTLVYAFARIGALVNGLERVFVVFRVGTADRRARDIVT